MIQLPFQIVALDISLARTGWASLLVDADACTIDHGVLPTPAVPPGSPDYYPLTLARIRRLIERIEDEITVHDATRREAGEPDAPLYVVMEAASFGTSREKAAQADARAGLRWMTYDRIEPHAEVVALVPPASLKMYVTGKGGAGKPAIIAAIREAFPERWVTDDNEADALGLAAMLARQLGYPIDAEQTWHVPALLGMKWPAPISTRPVSAYELDGLT
jgi:hypothetical protein